MTTDLVRLENGRQVTRGTLWWIRYWSGSRGAPIGLWLCCVHGVRLSERCDECAA